MGVVVPKVASATADATGKATFTFPAVTQGYAWTGTLSIGSAPSGAVGQVYRDNVPMLQVLGGNTSGTVQGGPGNLITINATGLSPAQQYTATWWVEEVASTTAKPPDPTQSVTQIANPETVDYLGTFTLNNVGNNLTGVACGPALSQYQGFMVIPISGAALNEVCAATVQNASKGTQARAQTWQGRTAEVAAAPLFIPTPADVGDSLNILAAVPNNVGVTLQVAVYGLGLLPPNAPKLRPDGRLPPVGAFYAAGAANNTIVTLVSGGAGGVPTPWHLLLKSASLAMNATAGQSGLNLTINGAGAAVLGGYTAGSEVAEFDSGLLGDSGTGCTVQSTNAGMSALALILYDLVY